jgi:hypothetical protein
LCLQAFVLVGVTRARYQTAVLSLRCIASAKP